MHASYHLGCKTTTSLIMQAGSASYIVAQGAYLLHLTQAQELWAAGEVVTAAAMEAALWNVCGDLTGHLAVIPAIQLPL